MFRITLRVIAIIQMLLGLAYLIVPNLFLHQLGHSQPAPDLLYPLGMLAARFLAYGAGFWIISSAPEKHVLWIRLMALIQLIDLLVGAFYTVQGVVPVSLSAFPMVNAVWIGLLCFYWKPIQEPVLRRA
ncbi:hypothetical protein [Solimicrobium silvestre]|uniref:DoxX-like family n=1 Tax=Solimicrobium silvestre TaxID=2099400 RepID=A0A2S9H259_9BURK|nr:hypothetical protein [Solimicrobium silvestre]PRC94048.1 hypothetical protein S2091_1221 [Solimicrobium silvestre]